MKPRTLALFEFVEEQRERKAGTQPSWCELVMRWDTTQREERRYGGERSHLRRDYERARRYLTEAPGARHAGRPTARLN